MSGADQSAVLAETATLTGAGPRAQTTQRQARRPGVDLEELRRQLDQVTGAGTTGPTITPEIREGLPVVDDVPTVDAVVPEPEPVVAEVVATAVTPTKTTRTPADRTRTTRTTTSKTKSVPTPKPNPRREARPTPRNVPRAKPLA